MKQVITIYGAGTIFGNLDTGNLLVAIGKKHLIIPEDGDPKTLEIIERRQNLKDPVFNLEISKDEVIK